MAIFNSELLNYQRVFPYVNQRLSWNVVLVRSMNLVRALRIVRVFRVLRLARLLRGGLGGPITC